MSENFTPDPKIQQVAEAYALDAVDFARDNFRRILDWSNGSVADIEAILSVFHAQLAEAKPSEEDVWVFAKMFGSYIGEVYRRNHGATWGMVNMQGQEFPGMKSTHGDKTFWPWGKVHNRLMNGDEDNVWFYYQVLSRKEATPDPEEDDRTGADPDIPHAAEESKRKPWWQFWKS
jgi:hypothetical protein